MDERALADALAEHHYRSLLALDVDDRRVRLTFTDLVRAQSLALLFLDGLYDRVLDGRSRVIVTFAHSPDVSGAPIAHLDVEPASDLPLLADLVD